MKDTSSVERMARALNFLHEIENSTPVSEFIRLDLTGNDEADLVLAKVSMMMLEFLKHNGFMKSDDLSRSDAKIYGLTPDGIKMHRTFFQLMRQA